GGRGLERVITMAQPHPWRHLGALIAQERARAGLTQAEVAKRLGKPPAWVQRLEVGRPVKIVELIMVAEAIGFEAAQLLARFQRERGGGLPKLPGVSEANGDLSAWSGDRCDGRWGG